MKHEDFPIEGYEFMNEAATKEQKEIIIKLARTVLNITLEINQTWPVPFSKWDAKRMISALRKELTGEEENEP